MMIETACTSPSTVVAASTTTTTISSKNNNPITKNVKLSKPSTPIVLLPTATTSRPPTPTSVVISPNNKVTKEETTTLLVLPTTATAMPGPKDHATPIITQEEEDSNITNSSRHSRCQTTTTENNHQVKQQEEDVRCKESAAALALSALYKATGTVETNKIVSNDNCNDKKKKNQQPPPIPPTKNTVSITTTSATDTSNSNSIATVSSSTTTHNKTKTKKKSSSSTSTTNKRKQSSTKMESLYQRAIVPKLELSIPIPSKKQKLGHTSATKVKSRSTTEARSPPINNNNNSNQSDESSLNTRYLQSQESLSSIAGSPPSSMNKYSPPPYLARSPYYNHYNSNNISSTNTMRHTNAPNFNNANIYPHRYHSMPPRAIFQTPERQHPPPPTPPPTQIVSPHHHYPHPTTSMTYPPPPNHTNTNNAISTLKGGSKIHRIDKKQVTTIPPPSYSNQYPLTTSGTSGSATPLPPPHLHGRHPPPAPYTHHHIHHHSYYNHHPPPPTPLQYSTITSTRSSPFLHHHVSPNRSPPMNGNGIIPYPPISSKAAAYAASKKHDALPKMVTPAKTEKLTRSSSSLSIAPNSSSYSRKDKSLGLLCENFISKYGGTLNHHNTFASTGASHTNSNDICIDIAAQSLGVERRRIYDIINILEAIQIVSRKCKNTYYWHGVHNLQATFGKMQQHAFQFWRDDAIRNGLILPSTQDKNNSGVLYSIPQSLATTTNTNNRLSPNEQKPKSKCGIDMLLQSAQEAADKEQYHHPAKNINNSIRPYSLQLTKCISHQTDTSMKHVNPNNAVTPTTAKEKSLGKLGKKFIQLFLVGNDTISLTEASDKILGPGINYNNKKKKQEIKAPIPEEKRTKEQKEADAKKAAAAVARGLKTKIRRLYDIANVMVSIGVIEKINSGNMNNCLKNRPSFRWVYHLSPQDILRLHNNQSDDTKSFPSSSANTTHLAAPVSFLTKVQNSNVRSNEVV